MGYISRHNAIGICHVTLGLAFLLASGCGRVPPEAPSEQALIQISSIKAASRNILDTLPEATDELPGLLAKLYAALPPASPEIQRQTLMFASAGDNLGVYLFLQRLDELKTASPPEALEFCRTVQARAAGSQLGAAAFDRELDLLQQDGDALAARCDEALRQTNWPAITHIALLRLAAHHAAQGKYADAARNYLRLMAIAPAKAAAVGAPAEFRGLALQAGWLLEADIVDDKISPQVLQWLDEDLSKAEYSLTRAYTQCVPDHLRASAEAAANAQPTPPSPLQSALFQARLARLAAAKADTAAAHAAFQAFAAACCEQDSLDTWESAIVICETASALLECMAKMTPPTPETIKESATDVRAKAFRAALTLAPAPDASLQLLERFLEKPNHAGLDDTILSHAQTTPQPLKARILFSLAQRLEEDKETKKALALYQQVAQPEHDSPLVEDAAARIWALQITLKDFPAAQTEAARFLEAYPASEHACAAKLVLGMAKCEQGDHEAGQALLTKAAEEYAGSECAAQIIFASAQYLLTTKQYAPALEKFTHLVEFYPDSDFAFQARPYLAELGGILQRQDGS